MQLPNVASIRAQGNSGGRQKSAARLDSLIRMHSIYLFLETWFKGYASTGTHMISEPATCDMYVLYLLADTWTGTFQTYLLQRMS